MVESLDQLLEKYNRKIGGFDSNIDYYKASKKVAIKAKKIQSISILSTELQILFDQRQLCIQMARDISNLIDITELSNG